MNIDIHRLIGTLPCPGAAATYDLGDPAAQPARVALTLGVAYLIDDITDVCGIYHPRHVVYVNDKSQCNIATSDWQRSLSDMPRIAIIHDSVKWQREVAKYVRIYVLCDLWQSPIALRAEHLRHCRGGTVR